MISYFAKHLASLISSNIRPKRVGDSQEDVIAHRSLKSIHTVLPDYDIDLD